MQKVVSKLIILHFSLVFFISHPEQYQRRLSAVRRIGMFGAGPLLTPDQKPTRNGCQLAKEGGGGVKAKLYTSLDGCNNLFQPHNL